MRVVVHDADEYGLRVSEHPSVLELVRSAPRREVTICDGYAVLLRQTLQGAQKRFRWQAKTGGRGREDLVCEPSHGRPPNVPGLSCAGRAKRDPRLLQASSRSWAAGALAPTLLRAGGACAFRSKRTSQLLRQQTRTNQKSA